MKKSELKDMVREVLSEYGGEGFQDSLESNLDYANRGINAQLNTLFHLDNMEDDAQKDRFGGDPEFKKRQQVRAKIKKLAQICRKNLKEMEKLVNVYGRFSL
jgi:N-methylhydantoinase B/oxoprolinase/acetone carboxylase alpha subunit